MGDKMAARRAMAAAGVPVVPGFEGTGDEDEATLRREADRIGYPVLVKAAGGGGGRGMRVVRAPEELGGAVESAMREALRAFGDARLFLEMTPRIQGEHPVTEMVTGVALGRAQIRIPPGEPLPVRQEEVRQDGHALECRVNAEDPARGFPPSAGRILLASFPSGAGTRVDAGVATGDVVSSYYDSLLAKIIVHAGDRQGALQRMQEALGKTAILGVETNLSFLRTILAHPVFRAGAATTSFIERELSDWRPEATGLLDHVLIAAALADTLRPAPEQATPSVGTGDEETDLFSPWGRLDGFRPGAV